MSGYVTIPDRVPIETIAGLTNAALRVYLERNRWLCVDVWQHPRGGEVKTYKWGGSIISVVDHDRFADRTQRMAEALGFVVFEHGLRSADVIAELQGIQQEAPT